MESFLKFHFQSVYTLLVYRNTIVFCILLLFSSTLLNLFISTNSFLIVYMTSLGLSIYQIMPSVNRDSFISCPIWMLVSFYSDLKTLL